MKLIRLRSRHQDTLWYHGNAFGYYTKKKGHMSCDAVMPVNVALAVLYFLFTFVRFVFKDGCSIDKAYDRKE